MKDRLREIQARHEEARQAMQVYEVGLRGAVETTLRFEGAALEFLRHGWSDNGALLAVVAAAVKWEEAVNALNHDFQTYERLVACDQMMLAAIDAFRETNDA